MTGTLYRSKAIVESELHQGKNHLVPDSVSHRDSGRFSYAMLLVYTVSFLLHIPERIPAIAVIRPDLILLGLLAFSLIGADWTRVTSTKPGKLLLLLCAWIILTVPFVEWPGSVIRDNWKPFLKAIIFFFAIVLTIDNKRRLAIFLGVFLGCQLFRVIEPLYLHVTQGYWGSAAHLGGGEFLDRLSGAPADIINPNGLGFVIVILLPFLHMLLFGASSRMWKAAYIFLFPLLLYALALSGSRSGLIGVVFVFVGITYYSRHRSLMTLLAVVIFSGFVLQLNEGQRDRFASIVSTDTNNAATAQGRIRGWGQELSVGMKNPVFGYGIATSKEALFNVNRSGQVSHNLYMEALIELGAPGAVLFFWFLGTSFYSFKRSAETYDSNENGIKTGELGWVFQLRHAITISFLAWFVFHLAQYGLTEYHWYVLCGLAVVVGDMDKKFSKHSAVNRTSLENGKLN